MKKTIKIQGMHCENCKRRVENALKAFGNTEVSVDLKNGEAIIISSSMPDNGAIKNAVEELGFDVISIE